MPRVRDAGAISLTRADMDTVEEARTNPRNPGDRTFGLGALDIKEVLRMIGPVVSFWNTSGEAHVRMVGCGNPEVAAFVASLARVLRPPGP